MDDLAHAFKHVKAGQPAKPNLVANQVISKPGGFSSGFDPTAFDVGSVTFQNDPRVNMLEVVREAIAFVRSRLDNPPHGRAATA